MKKDALKWYYLPLITVVLAFFYSCQQTEESILQSQEDYEVDARSLLLSATPSALSFATTVGTPVQHQTTIRLAGTGLSTLTSFQVYFVGEGAESFSAEVPNPSLSELLTGVPITVTYLPTTEGVTNVQMVVMGSLMGLIDFNTSVDVFGQTFTVDPPFGSTIHTEIINYSSTGDKAYFKCTFTFSDDMQYGGGFGSDDERYVMGFDPRSTTSRVGTLEFESFGFLPVGTENFRTVIPEGQISDKAGNPIQPIEVYYTLVHNN